MHRNMRDLLVGRARSGRFASRDLRRPRHDELQLRETIKRPRAFAPVNDDASRIGRNLVSHEITILA